MLCPLHTLPPPALEMDTQDAGVTLIRSVAKLQLLKFDARSRACFICGKGEPGEYRSFCLHIGTLWQSVVKSCSCRFLLSFGTFTLCYIFLGISLKKLSGIFVSFPFSALRSERQLTLLIPFYVNVRVAEN